MYLFGSDDICQLDSDCEFLWVCGADGTCEHKPIMPLTLYEIIAYIGIFVCEGVFQAAGMGGGELFVTYMMVVMRFKTKDAIFFTYAIILGGAIGKFLWTANAKLAGKPVIHYDIVRLVLPALLIGTLIGGYLKHALPGIILLIFLALLLILATVKIFMKAQEAYKIETNIILGRVKIKSFISGHYLEESDDEELDTAMLVGG